MGFSQNGLPDGTKPLPAPILTNLQRFPLAFNWEQFHKKCSCIHNMCWEITRIKSNPHPPGTIALILPYMQNSRTNIHIQSNSVISHLLGAKIRDCNLSGSPIASHFRAKATIHDLQDHRPTLGDKFANRISNNSHFSIFDKIEIQNRIDRWSYRPVNCICTKKFTVHRVSFRFSAGVEVSVTWHTQDSGNCGHCLLTVRGCLRRVKIGAKCVKYVWLSCPAWPSRWVLFISMQGLRLKGCRTWWMCMWTILPTSSELPGLSCATGRSQKFAVLSASTTNWFPWVNRPWDNGIQLYIYTCIYVFPFYVSFILILTLIFVLQMSGHGERYCGESAPSQYVTGKLQ